MGASVLAMKATVTPVSIAVELETLVTSALRYCSVTRRQGLDCSYAPLHEPNRKVWSNMMTLGYPPVSETGRMILAGYALPLK